MFWPPRQSCAAWIIALILINTSSSLRAEEKPRIDEVTIIETLISLSGKGFVTAKHCTTCPVVQYHLTQKSKFQIDDLPITRKQSRRIHWDFGFITYIASTKEVLLLNKMP